MEIRFRPLTDARHRVTVTRDDGTTEVVELPTEDFLLHDLAHYAVEAELGVTGGVWGSVAAGGSLSGKNLDGADMELAESLVGPVQTLLRDEAGLDEIQAVLSEVAPDRATVELAQRFHHRLRALRGQWRATPFGSDMVLTWPS
jgi:hypothetical protein